MNDFLSRLAAKGSKPIARVVTILGETDTVYFRLLTAAERQQLVGGRPIQVRKGEAPTVTIDLGDSESNKQKLVHFCLCDEKGKPAYRDLDTVRQLPSQMIDVLAAEAEKVNEEALGKEGNAPGES